MAVNDQRGFDCGCVNTVSGGNSVSTIVGVTASTCTFRVVGDRSTLAVSSTIPVI